MKLKDLEQHMQDADVNPFYIGLSDLMILLCVFFAMIISVSRIDKGSYEKIRSGVTGTTENTMVALEHRLKTIVEVDPGIPGVTVKLEKEGLRLDLDTVALFDTGSAAPIPGALDPFEPLFTDLLATEYRIDVEGHTDDVPLHRQHGDEIETNWSLSGRRAASVVHHLLEFGFSPTRVRIVGYADTKPKVDVSSKVDAELEMARSENRRVSLLIQ